MPICPITVMLRFGEGDVCLYISPNQCWFFSTTLKGASLFFCAHTEKYHMAMLKYLEIKRTFVVFCTVLTIFL